MLENIKQLANECLECINKPCQKGCPLSNDTQGFIKLVKEDKCYEAYELLSKTTIFSSICGRVCPHEKQCEGNCIKRYKSEPVQIGKLEAFIVDMAIKNNWEISTDIKEENKTKKVAIVGGGPAGLSCAFNLARKGYDVTIYERHEKLGGIIQYGIPDFRLDRKILDNTIDRILSLNIKVKYNQELGKDFTLSELENNYDAIFLGFGKNISNKLNAPGEEINGVLGGNELLEFGNYPDFKNKNVLIIGGGDVSMDISRTIKRLGAKTVKVIYRRSREEMPAEDNEIDGAINDGVEFLFQTNIVRVLGDNKVTGIECIKTELIEKENETRKVPVNIDGSNFLLDADFIIRAIGSKVNGDLTSALNLELNTNGTIKVNEKYQTSNPKVFCGGDLAGSTNTIAWAAKDGRDAAGFIEEYLKNI